MVLQQISDSKPTNEELVESAGHELAMNLRRAYLTMHRAVNACFMEYGLSADSFTVLTALTNGGAMTQKELVHKIASDANTVSAMLNRLERNKLVARKRDRDDGRARVVRLTAKGRRMQETLWKKSRPYRIDLANLFKPAEQLDCIEALKRMTAAMAGKI